MEPKLFTTANNYSIISLSDCSIKVRMANLMKKCKLQQKCLAESNVLAYFLALPANIDYDGSDLP